MAEKVCDAKLIMVFQFCDKCEEGKMIPTGIVVSTNPPQYEHQCELCGNRSYYSTTYPVQRIIPLEALREPKVGEVYG